MTMIRIFAGLNADGEPTTRLEHPFFVTQGRKNRAPAITLVRGKDGRLRHVRQPAHYRNVAEVSRKTGLPRTYWTTGEAPFANTRQSRRQQSRRNAKFTQLGGAAS